jgi:hypothetical protein
MKTLWTFGCSFTAEYYPVGENFARSYYDDYKDWRGGTLPDIWPTILGNKLNLKVENKAFGGDSNYAILNQFLNVVDLIKENDIVIFGWTNVVRFQAANPKSYDGFNQILPSMIDYPDTGLSKKSIEEILINRSDSIWLTEVLNWIKFINLYCDKMKINIFHWSSDENILNCKNVDINDKRYITPPCEDEEQNHHLLLGYLSEPFWYGGKRIAKLIEETDGLIPDCHFGEHGHRIQAEYFYKHIIDNLL